MVHVFVKTKATKDVLSVFIEYLAMLVGYADVLLSVDEKNRGLYFFDGFYILKVCSHDVL